MSISGGFMIKITITKSDAGKQAKDFLESFHLSKAKIHQLFQAHKITKNQEVIHQHDILNLNDAIEIDLSVIEQKEVEPFDGPIDIVYEDEDILILNKPKFILVHTDGQTIDTLTNRVAYHKSEHLYQILPVHRLDFETSGLLVFGKNPLTQAFLSHQFEERLVEKIYLASVEGVVKKDHGTIDKPIARDRHSSKQRISQSGKKATSMYSVIRRDDDQSLCEIKIIGGRKHQIRVHMAAIGHPVVGDQLYGHLKKMSGPLALQFISCTLIHPRTKTKVTYSIKK